MDTAIFHSTIRGRPKLIYMGQPYVFEKQSGDRKLWRCNQWWNARKCRARAYTMGNIVGPVQKYHTHEDVVYHKMPAALKFEIDYYKKKPFVNHEPHSRIVDGL